MLTRGASQMTEGAWTADSITQARIPDTRRKTNPTVHGISRYMQPNTPLTDTSRQAMSSAGTSAAQASLQAPFSQALLGASCSAHLWAENQEKTRMESLGMNARQRPPNNKERRPGNHGVNKAAAMLSPSFPKATCPQPAHETSHEGAGPGALGTPAPVRWARGCVVSSPLRLNHVAVLPPSRGVWYCNS